MKGFGFTTKVPKKVPLLLASCGQCGLFRSCLSPKMPVAGKGKKGILVLGEAPGRNEDEQGKPFIGKAGRLLQEYLRNVDIDLFRDCWVTNSLICRPPGNRTPSDKEIIYCQPNVLKVIRDTQPRLIIPLGGRAVKSLLSWLWKDDVGEISRWVGWQIPCQRLNAWIAPTWHPSYTMRTLADGKPSAAPLLFQKHLAVAANLQGRPWDEVPDYKKKVRVEYDTSRVVEILDRFARGDRPVAFDYETTTLKPDGPKAAIHSVSFSDGWVTISCPWHGGIRGAAQSFLRSRVPKIGANLQFEQRWTLKEFGHEVRNFAHDVVLCAHTLDNRQKVAGVKFQAFVQLGQEPYGEQIAPFLKAKDGVPNGENRIKEAPRYDLLLYNGLDALLEWEIAMKQLTLLGVKL